MIGAGQRGAQVYGAFARRNPNDIVFVAVAEPDEARRKEFAGIMVSARIMRWEDWMNCWHALKWPIVLCVHTGQPAHCPCNGGSAGGIPCGDGKTHEPQRRRARELKALAEEKGKLVTVCHVLRYTPFFSKVKELLDAGKIGQLQSVQQIENVLLASGAQLCAR